MNMLTLAYLIQKRDSELYFFDARAECIGRGVDTENDPVCVTSFMNDSFHILG